jgi:hypothetical protein
MYSSCDIDAGMPNQFAIMPAIVKYYHSIIVVALPTMALHIKTKHISRVKRKLILS